MAKSTAKASYGAGFGPQDDLFGELGRTNNPNAVRQVSSQQGGLDPALRRIIEQNTGTTRRTMGGQLEDPLAPQGIDWLRDNGGRGQQNSWDQPMAQRNNTSALASRQAADMFRADREQSTFNQNGNRTMQTPYGMASNVPMQRNIPEEGSQRLPMQEGAQLAAMMSQMFNAGGSQPPMTAEPYGPPSSAIDIFARDTSNPVLEAARNQAMAEALGRVPAGTKVDASSQWLRPETTVQQPSNPVAPMAASTARPGVLPPNTPGQPKGFFDDAAEMSLQTQDAVLGDRPGLLPMLGRTGAVTGGAIWDLLGNAMWRSGDPSSQTQQSIINWLMQGRQPSQKYGDYNPLVIQ